MFIMISALKVWRSLLNITPTTNINSSHQNGQCWTTQKSNLQYLLFAEKARQRERWWKFFWWCFDTSFVRSWWFSRVLVILLPTLCESHTIKSWGLATEECYQNLDRGVKLSMITWSWCSSMHILYSYICEELMMDVITDHLRIRSESN